jgi:hypothetical protein
MPQVGFSFTCRLPARVMTILVEVSQTCVFEVHSKAG